MSAPKPTLLYVEPLPETGTIDANSAYAIAAKLHAKAVNKNKKITAGPPSKLALPIVLKTPAPTIAAIPKKTKSFWLRYLPKLSLDFFLLSNSCKISGTDFFLK